MTSELDTLEKELADLEDGGKDGGPPKRKLGTAPLVVAILAVSALGGLVYYAYDQGIREGTEVAAPLLAPEGPAKVKPEDPGGLAVPHRDKTVYDVVQGGASDTSQEKVETLLPPPEEPMAPPAAAPAAEPVVTATNKLNEAEKPAVPEISPPPLPSEELAAPEAPATLSEQTEEKIEEAQEKVAETVAAITPPPAEPAPEPAAAATPPAEAQSAAPAASQTAPVETAAKATTATQGTDPAISQKWRIQVGAVRTQEGAVQEWARILRTNKELVGGLTLQVQEVDVTGKGTFFRIRGGPMADKDAADALCSKLKAKKIPCIPVRPGA